MKLFTLSLMLVSLSSLYYNETPPVKATLVYSDENALKEVCTLQLVKLECIQAEGFVTLDAIYFKIGNQEWPSRRLRMGPSYPNNIADLEGYVDLEFSGSITIELWDDDTWDPDDFLGSNTISCSYNNSGVARFTQDGANYKLYYRVK
ncbi:MAG: hypothetical protein R2795_22245 [Saprospiraceae bacterium]